MSNIDELIASSEAKMTEAANESIFTGPKEAEKVLAKVQKKIDKCKTVEECSVLQAQVKNEAAKFNDCMKTMVKAAKDFKAGTIDKKALEEKIAPCVTELKKNCEILKFGEFVGNKKKSLTDEDISNLHAFLVGFLKAVNKKKAELSGNGGAAKESVTEADKFAAGCESLMININNPDQPATEAFEKTKMTLRIRFSKDRKAAKLLMKQAKGYMKEKNYDEAISTYKKAKAAFKELISQLKAVPDYDFTGIIGHQVGSIGDKKTENHGEAPTVLKADTTELFKNYMTKCDERIQKCTILKKKASAE